MFSIEKLRSELTRVRSEILLKKDEAQKQMIALEENGSRLLEDVKRIENELESSVDEERLLVNEFNRLVDRLLCSVCVQFHIRRLMSHDYKRRPRQHHANIWNSNAI